MNIKLINKIMRNNFEILREYEPYLLDNFDFINELIYISENYNVTPMQGPLSRIERGQTISLVLNFLMTISEDYYNNFLKMLDKNNITFKNDSSNRFYIDDNDNKRININERNTLFDAVSLVHEFFHSQNYNLDNNNYYRNSYSETVSIISETMFLDFLSNNNLYKYDVEILKNWRHELYNKYLNDLKSQMPIYGYYKNYGSIDDEFMYKHPFIQIEHVICMSKYKYIIGMDIASEFFLLGYGTKELVELNNSLYNDDMSRFKELIFKDRDLIDLYKSSNGLYQKQLKK